MQYILDDISRTKQHIGEGRRLYRPILENENRNLANFRL